MKAQNGRHASDTINSCGCMTATKLPVPVRNHTERNHIECSARREDDFLVVDAAALAGVTRARIDATHPIICYTCVPATLL